MNGIRGSFSVIPGLGLGGLDSALGVPGAAPGGDLGLLPEGLVTEPGAVDPLLQQDGRRLVNAQGSDVQQRLLAQTGGRSQDGYVDPQSLLGGIDGKVDPATEKQLVKLLNGLGFNVDKLDSAEGRAAIRQTKEYAGFVPTSDLDIDAWMALIMAMAERDRGGGGGGARSSGGRSSGGGSSRSRKSSSPSSGSSGSSGAAGGGPASGGRMELNKTKPVDTANWKAGKGDVSPKQLTDIAKSSGHSLSETRAREVAPHLNRAMAEANIDTPKKKAAFVAQLMHESGSFKYNEEIASGRNYEGRRDLGNTQPGDGERFKGRGFIQLTGRANYEAASKALGTDFVNNPKLAASDEHAARVAAWYWNSRGLNGLAEQGRFDDVTKRINGGFNGKADRDRLYGNALNVLKDSHGAPSTGEVDTAAAGTARAQSPSATDGMNEAQKYDYYANLIRQQGGQVNAAPGHRSIVGVRKEDQRQNAYDDRMAVIWKDDAGRPQVREFQANMESIQRYQGRFGNDVNGDGSKDLATLSAGTHEFGREWSGQYGNILRPTSTTSVMRDTDRDGRGDTLDRSGAGRSILFHKGGWNDTGSAGCQTMKPDDFDRFWGALGGQNRFSYTVVDTNGSGRANA